MNHEVIISLCVKTHVVLQEGLRRLERGFSGSSCSSFYVRRHVVFAFACGYLPSTSVKLVMFYILSSCILSFY